MISTKTVDWKIFQGGDNFLVAINLIYLVVQKDGMILVCLLNINEIGLVNTLICLVVFLPILPSGVYFD